ncbi:Translation initiation factor eIF3 subunit G [Gracilaria domingensis]|nr:Translation initiation factor eIF3 subunit G [Gracilaria domingensis]
MVTEISEAANADWGDDTEFASTGGIPPQEVVQNADGTKTVTDYGMSDDGYLSKTVSVIRVEKVTKTVSKAVAARKNWKKFGDCEGKPPGLERGVSTLSIDEINMEWVTNEQNEDEEEEEINFAKKAQQDIQTQLKMLRFKKRQEERKLGVANWAQMMSLQAAAKTPNETPAPGLRTMDSSAGAPGKYVPPSKRSGATASVGDSMYTRDDSATVRISNVSRSTEEADLEDLCKRFGPTRRIFLSRDRETGESKGFAFVAFVNVSDAARCIEKLNGFGYDHLILSVEWSKPKEPRDGESRSGFMR